MKLKSKLDFAFIQVIEQELNLFRLVELIRQKIFDAKKSKNDQKAFSTDLNLIAAFNEIDTSKNGNFTKSDLLKFLNKYVLNAVFNIEDINILFRRLRIKTEGQTAEEAEIKSISYLQFVNMILPVGMQNQESAHANKYSGFDKFQEAYDQLNDKKPASSKSRYKSIRSAQIFNNNTYQTQESRSSSIANNLNENSHFNNHSSSQSPIRNNDSTNPQQRNQSVDKYTSQQLNSNLQSSAKKSRNGESRERNYKSMGGVAESSQLYKDIRKGNKSVAMTQGSFGASKSQSKYNQLRQNQQFQQSQNATAKSNCNKQQKQFNYKELQNQASKSRQTPIKQSQNYNQQTYQSSLYENTIEDSRTPNRSGSKSNNFNQSRMSIISQTTPARAKSPIYSNLLTNNTKHQLQNEFREPSSTSKSNSRQNYHSAQKKFDQNEYDLYHKLRRGYISPMKGKEEEVFVNILKEQLKLECNLEEVKEGLVLYCNDFNSVQAFRVFVPSTHRVHRNINVQNVIDAFQNFGIQLNMTEAELMMKRFDSNRDGHLTYTDICDVFRPKNIQLAREFDLRMPFDHQISNHLSQNSVKYITQLFSSLVQVESNIEIMKRQLNKRPDFNITEAFSVLNMDGYKKVSQEDLQQILKVHGLITFHREANALFTRYDKDKDGLINMDDFTHEMKPMTTKGQLMNYKYRSAIKK
eukprot:403362091